MARGSATAQQGATAGLNNSNALMGNAEGVYSTLAPQLSEEAAHPAGFNPSDLAAMNTAEQQSAGGSEAGAVGQGALLASRTKNAGTADAAIAESARRSGQQLSEGALQTQMKNAALKNEQQQEGLRGEESLFGTGVSGANQALGESAANTNANTEAVNSSWDWAKDILDPALSAAGQAGSAYLRTTGSQG